MAMLDDLPPAAPALPATPLDVLGPTVTEEIPLGERTFRIERPDESDKLLGHPSVRDAIAGEVYVPYWTDLWPAARMLGKWILRQRWPAKLTALEVGCGLGLPGLAALSMGVDVTFSDYDSTALHFARRNALINALPEPKTLQFDWRFPPDGVQFPVLLLADLIYEGRHVAPLIRLIRRMLAPVGVCLLTDQDRVPSSLLRRQLADAGFPFTTTMLRAGEPGGTRFKGTLYRITQPGGTDPLV
jgi:predicted nicotinamide N-methyase